MWKPTLPSPTTSPLSPRPPPRRCRCRCRRRRLRRRPGEVSTAATPPACSSRRYLLKEFPELINSKDCAKILEVGCGNGSTVVPMLRCNSSITVYACDCSKDTLEKANEIVCNTKGLDAKDRFHPFLLDVSKETFPEWLFCKPCQSSCANAVDLLLDSSHHNIRKEQPDLLKEHQCCIRGIDFITMIFTLSAIPFDMMSTTLQRCVSVLKPGGLVLFRDYGLYDMTMLRFPPHQRVGFREYMRADGTFSYFFSLDTLRGLFHSAGLLEGLVIKGELLPPTGDEQEIYKSLSLSPPCPSGVATSYSRHATALQGHLDQAFWPYLSKAITPLYVSLDARMQHLTN